jgi:hypothetical protein
MIPAWRVTPYRRCPTIERREEDVADPKTIIRARKTDFHGSSERRRTLRISAPFPIRVRGISAAGERRQFEAELDNLGAGGLYLRAAQDIRMWTRIMIRIRLSLAPDAAGRAAVVAARGAILRTEPQPDQRLGFAIAIKGYRFI